MSADLDVEYRKQVALTQEIDAQLSSRKPIGRVPDAEWREYQEWRAGALQAKKTALKRARALKDEIKRQNMERHARAADGLDPYLLLRRCLAVLDDLEELSVEDFRLKTEVQAWVDGERAKRQSGEAAA